MSKSASPRAPHTDWTELERRVEADNFAQDRWLELWEQDQTGQERRRVGWSRCMSTHFKSRLKDASTINFWNCWIAGLLSTRCSCLWWARLCACSLKALLVESPSH